MISDPNDLALDVFNHYFDLRREYGEVSVKCVLHDDTHASASVNIDEGLWNCMVCNEGGDAIQLVRKMEGLDFRAAKRWIEREFGTSHGTVRDKPGGQSSYDIPRRTRDNRAGGSWCPSWLR